MTVAVGAGSRGLTGRVELLQGAVRGLRELGAEPFVVPAMGSHGGGTADGQRDMLHHLGVTEESIGCEIRSTMETEQVAHTAAGMPLYLDKYAAGADRILPALPECVSHSTALLLKGLDVDVRTGAKVNEVSSEGASTRQRSQRLQRSAGPTRSSTLVTSRARSRSTPQLHSWSPKRAASTS